MASPSTPPPVPSTMNAVHISSFVQSYSSLHVSSIPTPTPTAPDELLIKLTHAGLNYVDLLYARGKHQNNTSLVRPPFTLGLEFAGVVVRSGTTSASASSDAASSSSGAADAFPPGTRVFGGGLGCFAEYVVVKASQARRVPEGWSNAAAAGMAATAPVSYGALARIAGLKAGETVLVHAAAGGLGVMAVQVARALGADVVACVGSEGKAGVVRDVLGVEAGKVIRYDVEGWEKRVLDVTGGEGVDVVYDTVGLVEQSIRCTKYAGRIIVAGFAGREGNLEKIAANRILLKSITVIGYRFGENGRRFPGETEAVWKGLNVLVRKGLIKPVTYSERFQGLDSVPRAMTTMADRKVWGKAIIEVSSQSEKANL